MGRYKTILLVEDDEVDIMTVKRAMKEVEISKPLEVARNGEEALDYLNSKKPGKPYLILLDLNMPRMNGFEFLKIAKKDEVLKTIPVIVLTTSKEERDIMESYNLGISGYMIKPVDYGQFVETIKIINSYWGLSKLPYNNDDDGVRA